MATWPPLKRTWPTPIPAACIRPARTRKAPLMAPIGFRLAQAFALNSYLPVPFGNLSAPYKEETLPRLYPNPDTFYPSVRFCNLPNPPSVSAMNARRFGKIDHYILCLKKKHAEDIDEPLFAWYYIRARPGMPRILNGPFHSVRFVSSKDM